MVDNYCAGPHNSLQLQIFNHKTLREAGNQEAEMTPVMGNPITGQVDDGGFTVYFMPLIKPRTAAGISAGRKTNFELSELDISRIASTYFSPNR